MKLKFLVLIAASIPTLAFAEVLAPDLGTGVGVPRAHGGIGVFISEKEANKVYLKAVEAVPLAKEMIAQEDKTTAPVPSATMASPVPPVSSSVNSQLPASYPGQSAVPQQSVGLPPPTIRAEMPGQVGQSAIPQPDVGMPPPTIRAEIPGQGAPSMSRPEPQIQNRSPAVNVGPGPMNLGVGR
jgi:hypothetical protein